MKSPMPLLGDDDPPAFRVLGAAPGSPYVLTADHAGRAIPKALGTLGLSGAELDTHIAWDIGIAGVTEKLAFRLGAFAILQTYSRLVIDCNRPLTAPSSIVDHSEYTAIPGNRSLTASAIEARVREIFWPYHHRIESELERRERAALPVILVAMHSFTPRFKEFDRPWHCGVLYQRDTRFAHRVLALLREEGLEVGDNQPYFVSDETDYGVVRYGEQRGNLHVELELRQDLIASEAEQAKWAELLARVLAAAATSP